MDTSDPEIKFDDQGVCNHCYQYDRRITLELFADQSSNERRLQEIITSIKHEGAKKEYDCILGVSGGVDSSYLAYIAKEFGLRPLAVHFDNGWDSELAVDNIRKILTTLDIDLLTYVVNWDEFCDLQKSFLKASVPNVEIPTDHAISAVLWTTAYKQGIRYILNGSNLRTEGIMPLSWTYSSYDYYHIRSIQRKFGSKPLRTYPKLGFLKFMYFVIVKQIKVINVLNSIDYKKESAIDLLVKKFDWRPYQEKHYESVWTRFYQGYYLLKKFGYDKLRAHLSALVLSGQMTREIALERIANQSYPINLFRKDYDYILKKFDLSEAEFEDILEQSPKSHLSYPNLNALYLQSSQLQDAFVRFARIK